MFFNFLQQIYTCNKIRFFRKSKCFLQARYYVASKDAKVVETKCFLLNANGNRENLFNFTTICSVKNIYPLSDK